MSLQRMICALISWADWNGQTCVQMKNVCLCLFITEWIHLRGGRTGPWPQGCTWNCRNTLRGPYNRLPEKDKIRKEMSCDMTKPKWLCTQWRLRSAWASAVRMKKSWVLSYPLSAQRRLWSDWANAKADLSLCWAHSHLVHFIMSGLISF